MKPRILIENLSKTWQTVTSGQTAVNDVSFTIEPGEFVCIIGKSGCGKSTLLNLISGQIIPDCGKIEIDGELMTGISQRKRTALRRMKIASIPQFFSLIPELTVQENLDLSTMITGPGIDAVRKEKLLKDLGLVDCINKYPHQLSGGQQQPAAIARAMIGHPSVILADEPTGNLDRISSQTVMRLLRDMQRNNALTVLMVTHDLDLAKQADRILYMEDGKVIPYGD